MSDVRSLQMLMAQTWNDEELKIWSEQGVELDPAAVKLAEEAELSSIKASETYVEQDVSVLDHRPAGFKVITARWLLVLKSSGQTKARIVVQELAHGHALLGAYAATPSVCWHEDFDCLVIVPQLSFGHRRLQVRFLACRPADR